MLEDRVNTQQRLRCMQVAGARESVDFILRVVQHQTARARREQPQAGPSACAGGWRQAVHCFLAQPRCTWQQLALLQTITAQISGGMYMASACR